MDIDHLVIPVSDYERAKRFYAEALAPLGFELLLDWFDERRAYFGVPPAPSSLWLVESDAAGALALSVCAPDVETVEAFARAAGVDPERNGRAYVARLVDPDGNAIEAVHRPAAAIAA
jgi:catechol 2,3-dioxygenase-like lactoylglutathione lyase family enzyme